MMTEMSWEVDEEVNRDKNGMNLEADSKYEVMHIYMSDLRFSRKWLAGEKEWQHTNSVYCEEVEER